jgi:hypothetical protein
MLYIKSLQLLASMILAGFIMYSYYIQVAGDPELRVECWKQGGILWHTLDQEKICIHVPQKTL